ncbi:winged helix DNA-binding domain-containing protein [Paenibacillus hodogayensis]|uniref:Winged helix DNA-binding domain-containing protein n=1 Tax=Paenibacillus hodogayensis TaxID=279208 RepID=A0ABV5VX02_9BACL
MLDRRALNRALLVRQLLLERSDKTAAEALEHLAGLQAQAPNPPYIALWARLHDFRHEQLSRLILERQAVRIALMRSTIHLVTADDCLKLRSTLAPVQLRGLQSNYGKRLAGLDLDAVAAAGRALLEEQPLTFSELGKRLAAEWPERDPAALAIAVRCLVPLVQVPPRGIWGASGQAAHTSAEAWLGADPAPPSQDALDELVLRYLGAFGPASVKDAQVWSGLTRLGDTMERLRPRLLAFRDESGTELFDLPDAPRPGADTPVSARFLGEFDNMLLSYADRTRIMTEEHKRQVFTENGIIRSVILVDGFVAGLWRIERQRGHATLIVEPFGPLTVVDAAELRDEGSRLLQFAAADART